MPSDVTAEAPEAVWLRNFVGAAKLSGKKAEQDKKRAEVIELSTAELKVAQERLVGLDFKVLVKKDANLKSRAKALFGRQDKIGTLTGTGNAMKELDSEHHKDKIESVSGGDLAKAYESMELIASAADKMDKGLMKIFCEENDIDPKMMHKLEEALEAKRRKEEEDRKKGRKGEEETGIEEKKNQFGVDDELLAKYQAGKEKTEKTVRDEVYQPLVRQGLMPENFVPDRHSEVARTFEGASELYQERLAEYTKEMGTTGELLAKLGIAQSVIDGTLKMASSIVEAVPGGELIKSSVETGLLCAEILNDAGFQIAGQVLQKQDALSIGQTVANGVTGILSSVAGVPEEVQVCVASGMQLALGGGKLIKGIMDGNPDNVLDALSSALETSLDLAAATTGDPIVGTVAKDVTNALTNGPKVAVLVKALKTRPADKQAIEAALYNVVSGALGQVGDVIQDIQQARMVKGGRLDTELQVGSDLDLDIGEVEAPEGVESKDFAPGLATTLGGLASSACAAFLPAAYGKAVGGALKSAIGKGGKAFGPAVEKGDTDAALAAIGELLARGFAEASKLTGGDKEVAGALVTAAKGIRGSISSLAGAAALKKAIAEGSAGGAKSAMKQMVDAFMAPILDKVDPGKLGIDLNGDDDEDEEEEDEEEGEEEGLEAFDEEARKARKEKAEFEARQRKIILAAKKVIDENKDPQKVEEAKKQRQDAINALLERKTLEDAIAADSKDFAALLNSDLSGGDVEDDGDDGDTRTLKTLIVTIQRDRMVIKMAEAVVGMGLGVAAHFFPPLAIAVDAKNVAIEGAKTVAHLRQLLLWKKNASEAKNAVTVQVHAMLNRVGLEEDAVIEHQMKMVLAMISMIGNIVATAGAHAAPAGIAITAAAKTARAGLEVALTIKTAAEMQTAWSKFQAAMKNPKDRINIRIAIQGNPTMAKYALVWGALQDDNPIAKKALKRCGLTDAIIAKERANVNNVVEYLEVLYEDDPVVLRCVVDTSGWGWAAPKPALSLRCWTEFLAAAQNKKTKPQMMPGSGGAITAAFGTLDQARGDLKTALGQKKRIEKFVKSQDAAEEEAMAGKTKEQREQEKPASDKRRNVLQAKLDIANKTVETAHDGLKHALEAMRKTCEAFKPVDKDGNPYERVAEWIDAIAALAEVEVQKLDGNDVAFELDDAA